MQISLTRSTEDNILIQEQLKNCCEMIPLGFKEEKVEEAKELLKKGAILTNDIFIHFAMWWKKRNLFNGSFNLLKRISFKQTINLSIQSLMRSTNDESIW